MAGCQTERDETWELLADNQLSSVNWNNVGLFNTNGIVTNNFVLLKKIKNCTKEK